MKEKIKSIICFIIYLLAIIGISYTVLIDNTFSSIVTVLIYALSLYMCSLSTIYIVKTKMLFWVGEYAMTATPNLLHWQVYKYLKTKIVGIK